MCGMSHYIDIWLTLYGDILPCKQLQCALCLSIIANITMLMNI